MGRTAWREILFALVVLFAPTWARASPSIESYGKLPALDMVRLSPSGEKIAFIVHDGDTRKLFVRSVGGDALLVSPVGTSKIRGLEWAGDDYLLISVSATLKFGTGALNKWSYSTRAELFLVFIANLKTKSFSQMFKNQQFDIFADGGEFNSSLIDGKWYDIVNVFVRGQGQQIYKVDLDSGNYSRVDGYDLYGYSSFFDGHGRISARSRYDEDAREWRLVTGDHGKDIVVARKSIWDTVDVGGAGRTDGSILVLEDGTETDTTDEYLIRPGAAPTPLFKGLYVDRYYRDPVTHLLIGASLTANKGAVFFDSKFQSHYDAVRRAFPGLQVNLVSYSADLGRIVVMTDGGDDPGTYWLVDMATGKADDLMAAYPDIDQKDVGPTSLFHYQARDGLALDGVLTLPPQQSGKALPLVVMPHGGPIGVSDRVGFDFWAQAFASRGYAVFQPNYRGSGGHGAAFRLAGYGQWGNKMLTDMSDGVQALAKTGVIDSGRVCIVGASYGGYAALAGVTIQRGIYRCAVSVAGVSDVGAAMLGTGDGDSSNTASGRLNQAVFGASFSGSPELARISPFRHADNADAPILIIHGKDDTVVPFVHSDKMNAALQRAGKTSELLALDGEDHWWSLEKTRIQILQASVGFVEKYNPTH